MDQVRKKNVEERIDELNTLLIQWEEKRDYSENPNERMRCESEIKKIKAYLLEYKKELTGGDKVVEDKSNPVAAPEIRRVNRQWIFGILIALLLLGFGYWGYIEMTKVQPNYQKYLEAIDAGDKYLQENNFVKAEKSYKMAMAYNPKDKVISQKVSLLKKAKKFITQNKNKEAKGAFDQILALSPSIAPYTDTTKKASGIKLTNGKFIPVLSIEMQWTSTGQLKLIIKGGLPFSTSKSPYQLTGLDCTDCITWEREGEEYRAVIKTKETNILNVMVKDRVGNFYQKEIKYKNVVPSGSISENDTSKDLKTDYNKKELYADKIIEADGLFAEKKFEKSISAYQEALFYKRNDDYCLSQIKKAQKILHDRKIAKLKNIPKKKLGAGSFSMGSKDGFNNENPTRIVKLSPFSIGVSEVTIAQYKAFCDETGHKMPVLPNWATSPQMPIVNVTWRDAVAFCKWVGGRLPTEAEWEYAAKGSNLNVNEKYSGGNNLSNLAHYNESGATKVKSKRANFFDLYDLTGNVAEWCSDWYDSKYYSKKNTTNDPKGASSGTRKIVRGGSYLNNPNDKSAVGNPLRVTFRNREKPSAAKPSIGFRVAWNG